MSPTSSPSPPGTPIALGRPMPGSSPAPGADADAFYTPPQAVPGARAWLDPNLPTPPSYGHGASHSGSPLALTGPKSNNHRRKASIGIEGVIYEPAKDRDVLTHLDVREDPILARLARQQGLNAAGPGTVAPGGPNTAQLGTVGVAAGLLGVRKADELPVQAKKNGNGNGLVFKAKPAPDMRTPGVGGRVVGPRLSKAAALRMGVWPLPSKDKVKDKDITDGAAAREREQARLKRAEEETRARAAKAAKRQSMVIPSLAAPLLAPRQNRTAQLRAAGGGTAAPGTGAGGGVGAGATPGPTPAVRRLKTAEEVAADKQARSKEEKEKRRQSIVLPASLSVPSIVPRMNRTTALRNGTATATALAPLTSTSTTASSRVSSSKQDKDEDSKRMPPPSSFPRSQSTSRPTGAGTLTSSTADNVRPVKGATAAMSVGLSQTDGKDAGSGIKGGRPSTAGAGGIRSLGAPSIVPRLNKSAMLRTAPRPSTSAGHPVSISGTTSTGPSARGPPVSGTGTGTAHTRSRSSSAADAQRVRGAYSAQAPSQTGTSSTAAARTSTSVSQRPAPVVRHTKASLLRAAALAKAG